MHIAKISQKNFLFHRKFLGEGKFLESHEMTHFREKEKEAFLRAVSGQRKFALRSAS
jgi:hypothetical protein